MPPRDVLYLERPSRGETLPTVVSRVVVGIA